VTWSLGQYAGQYLHFNKKGSGRLIWWVMENRREYFDRAKLLLGKARALVFLSETQEQLWRNWASQEALSLPSIVAVVGLSVSDDLAAVAGLAHSTGLSHDGKGPCHPKLLAQNEPGICLLPSLQFLMRWLPHFF
jgi:hypothetical protein